MMMSVALFLGIFMASVSIALELSIALDRHRRRRGARLARCVSGVAATGQRPQPQTPGLRSRSFGGARFAGPAGPGPRTGPGARLAAWVARGGLPLSLSELLAIGFVGALGLGGAGWLLLDLPLVASLTAALVLAGGAIWLAVSLATRQRTRRMVDSLPEALDIVVRGLRAGRPIIDALGIVATGTTGLLQSEFRRCSDEMRLGKTVGEALHAMADRLDAPELRAIAVATALQAETGGNLVETLENLSELLRERQKLRRKVAALTAEARVSAFILAGLPFVVGLAILMSSPRYLQPLTTDPRGQFMLVAGFVSLCLGMLSMRRMAKFDV